MADKRNVPINGKPMPGTIVKTVGQQGEPWTEYLLDDGTVLRLKLVLLEATRVDDAFESDGTPMYGVKWTVVQHALSPDSLKRATP